MAESEQKLKNLFLKEKGESENLTWKLNFQKNNIMASSTITSWKIDKEKVEAVTDFIFLGFKVMKLKAICSLEGKLLQSKQCIKKQRHHFGK